MKLKSNSEEYKMDKSIKKIPVIVVVGPTASGKSDFAVALAKIFNAEVVSADSMQIYKGMDIASAKITVDEMQGIRHHLIDFVSPDEKYSVARYIKDARKAIEEITERNKNVIICGGTGLYIDSLLNNINFEEQPDNCEVRELLRKRKLEEGMEALYKELYEIDPETAAALHINNEGRVLRALETYYLTGEKPSVIRRRSTTLESPYQPVFIGLEYSERQLLYDRINTRVDRMIEKGLVEEAREYFDRHPFDTASQAIGHKEFAKYLNGEISICEATDNLKRVTRNYAKRQMTWFRRNNDIYRIYCDKYSSFEEAVNDAIDYIVSTRLFKVGEQFEEEN